MSTIKKISDIILEYETYEYSRENLEITKEIMNLGLLEHKLAASEFYNNNIEMLTESGISDEFYMEKFEKIKAAKDAIVNKTKKIGSWLKTKWKNLVDTVIKFLRSKIVQLNDLVSNRSDIVKYLNNNSYNESVASAIKTACDKFPKDKIAIDINAKNIITNNEWSQLGDIINLVNVALNTDINFYMMKDPNSKIQSLPFESLIRYFDTIIKGNAASAASVKAGIEKECEDNSYINNQSKSSLKLGERILTSYINKLNRISTKLDKNITNTSKDDSNDLKGVNEALVMLKTSVGKTIAVYNSILTFRKEFTKSVYKAIKSSKKGSKKNNESKTESFNDFEFDTTDSLLDFIG